jgi:dUTP pyrophosphatase
MYEKTKINMIILDERLKKDEFKMGYAKPGDAGIDVRACVERPTRVNAMTSVLIPLGFKVHIGRDDIVAVLLPRSGMGHKNGIVLGNLVGVIDSEYQGQVFASCWNRNEYQDWIIEPMDKIAQMVFLPVIQAEFNLVDSFEESERGEGGFGSTGK